MVFFITFLYSFIYFLHFNEIMKNYLELFPDLENISAVFSTKQAGNLKDKNNQIQFFKQFDIDFEKVIIMEQTHSAKAQYVDESKNYIRKVDAVFTDKKGVYLTVNTADCLPIFIYGQNPEFISIIHAGWRGLVNGILQNSLQKADEKFKIDFSQVRSVVGPGIHKCCFEIKKDILHEFSLYKNFIAENKGKITVDLPGIAKSNLTRVGLKEYNIELIGECTCCLSDKYFSFRREKEKLGGEMLGFIGF